MIAPELADILVCPACKGLVAQDVPAQTLVCRSCQLAFPVRNHGGKMLPVMLVEEAIPTAAQGGQQRHAGIVKMVSNCGQACPPQYIPVCRDLLYQGRHPEPRS